MIQEGRRICLLIDNFSGHFIAYEPHNIHIEYFKPNMTSHIQPLNAGVIRCFKARYHQGVCMRAMELDEANETEIYNLNLLEAMCLANEAWDTITPSTISHCWNHTGIQP